MATTTFNGPIIRAGEHNIVLRDVAYHSPVARNVSSSDYHLIRIGVREGEFTTWIGTFDESTQFAEAAVPLRILDPRRVNLRLKAEQVLVVEVTATGTPATIEGSKINFRLGRVGGLDGPAKPLVAAGASVADADSRTAITSLERQINTGGLSDWEDSVQIHDPVALAPTWAFQGRLQVDSTTEISLQRYVGNWVEVNGVPVSITSAGRSLTTSNGLVTAQGGEDPATTPSADVLYYVYLNSDGRLRMSGTAPTAHNGTLYLGTGPVEATWRFCGWAYLDGSTQFTDSDISRLLCNYYNREVKDLFRSPGYEDDGAQTTYTEVGVVWSPANAGAGSQVVFLSNNEDAVVLHGTASASSGGLNTVELGLGIDSTITASRAGIHGANTTGNIAIHYSDVLSVGRHTADLLTRVSGGTGTYIADDDPNGGATDPPVTYISGQVLV